MAWVTFNVKQQNASSVSDGVANFSWGFDQSTPPNLTNVSLQYKINANAPARTLIQLDNVSPAPGGGYNLGTFDYPNNNKVVIPAAPPYGGGSYNQLANVVFTPSVTSPNSAGTISGTFQKVGIDGTEDPCNWDAAGTMPEPLPEQARKAAAY